MRRFNLVRMDDVSGCSGVGIVAEGAEAVSGKATLTWFSGKAGAQSTALFDSVDDIILIHGHEGRTVLEFVDTHHDNLVHTLVNLRPAPGSQEHEIVLAAALPAPAMPATVRAPRRRHSRPAPLLLMPDA